MGMRDQIVRLARKGRGVVAPAAAVGATIGVASSARATDASLPTASEIITSVGNTYFPFILPIISFGIGVAAVWFLFRTVKRAASSTH